MQKISTISDSCHDGNRTESEGYRGVQTFIGITENNLTEVRFTQDDLLEEILSPHNLNKAYKQVVFNHGSGGIDGMETDELLPWLLLHKEELLSAIRQGKYRPNPVLRVEIPQEAGKKRNFIEHISFNAFNEGTRGISSICYAQVLFRQRVTHFAGDAIYATNKTRKYCSSRPAPIYTSFLPKGKRAKDEPEKSKMRSLLSKERSTRLEGSFGTEKEHYNLRKIKARTPQTEILWILFGVHTANVARLAAKEQKKTNRPKSSLTAGIDTR